MRLTAAKLLAAAAGIAALATSATMWAQVAAPLDQGRHWTKARQLDFYSRDQGSRIMPLAWMRALRRADGTAFLPGGLDRYGYLDNPAAPDGLPVGFTIDSGAATRSVGMTCAACHTRDLEADGKLYRVDGGPAIVEFQAFLTDLDGAVGRVLSDPAVFAAFARDVRAAGAAPGDDAALRRQVAAWYLRYDTLIRRALPKAGWGLGRLDAVGMIFDRLTGLDLGPPPSFLIPDNIAPADAPVRYPFIWDAPKQDHTQWPGFAANGDDLLALARNLGEVYGVFGVFMPHASNRFLLGYDFVTDNSADFHGLRTLEKSVRRIGAPAWPWPIDRALAERGRTVFDRPVRDGGCQSCHGERSGQPRLWPPSATWATPRFDVGTDAREYQVLARVAASGAIAGALTPSLGRLKPVDRSIDVLATAVVGSILQHDFASTRGRSIAGTAADPLALVRAPVRSELSAAFQLPSAAAAAQPHVYEARVLHGIWAAAPYLHNGSVPTLRQLLTPPAARVAGFQVGRVFDRRDVGLAAIQHGLVQRRVTTGCDRPASGDSRCGHDYGTRLGEPDKRALIEYLKTL